MFTSSKMLFAVIAIGAVSTAFAAAPDFKEGEWGVNYRMEVIGMPFPMPPINTKKTMCLTKNNYVPDNSQQGQDCKVSDQKVSGNTVTWTMRCQTKEGKVEGKGKITYKGERYDGAMDAEMISSANPDMPMRYKYTMNGQRLGACSN